MVIDVFTLCDAATDSGGKLNIMGAFDTIFGQNAPAHHPLCAVAARLRFSRIEQGTHRLIIQIANEDGKMLMTLEAELEVKITNEEPFTTANLILNMQNMPLETFGEYAVDLAVDGLQVASFPFLFRQVKKL